MKQRASLPPLYLLFVLCSQCWSGDYFAWPSGTVSKSWLIDCQESLLGRLIFTAGRVRFNCSLGQTWNYYCGTHRFSESGTAIVIKIEKSCEFAPLVTTLLGVKDFNNFLFIIYDTCTANFYAMTVRLTLWALITGTHAILPIFSFFSQWCQSFMVLQKQK